MPVVVDASVAFRWMFGADSDQAESVLKNDTLIAPDLIIAEVTNAAWKSVVFENVDVDEVVSAMSEFSKYFGELVPANQLKDDALAIALELRHPAYDCFYLALARTRQCKLVTSDQRLVRTCAKSRYAGLLTSI